MGAINLAEFLKANESEIRWLVESLVLQRMTQAIGRENLDKVTLTFQGSAVDDIAVYVEGPEDLRTKVEEALRSPGATPYGRFPSPTIPGRRSG
jgi:hypothetical protein